ncbi:uncharacterized protein LOC143284594 [Babylonia areolata]|uniref:uncharacterized protein LOC143284594 n=1 Tax=Babylonia areolata TaxID=304850 RepID=UPI003FD20EA1
MWWIFAYLFWLLRNLFLEFVFFILVDLVAKAPLREATNYAEKRTIWLCEAGVLLGICGIVYWADHTPYLLFVLAVATGVYTQLCGRIDLRQWWASVRTRWEEYQQHEESMRQVQAHLARQQAVSASAVPQSSLAGAPGISPVLSPSQSPLYPHLMPAQGYPPNVTLLSGRELPGTATTSAMGPVFRGSHGGLIWSGLSQSNNASVGYFAQQSSNTGSAALAFQNRGAFVGSPVSQAPIPAPSRQSEENLPSRWLGGDLKRKPLRQIDSRSPTLGLASSGASAIKNKFMNALGFGGVVKKPPGLRNKGQNQCFMNAVLQCLARSPYLVPCLAVDAAKELEGTVSESLFLSTLSELLDLLTAEPETLDSNVLDPTAFRHASSSLNRNLVAPVNQQQSQQDSAEFLMWMLDMVHRILNKNRQALSCGSDTGNGEERFSSPRLAMLRFIYGDLTPAKARELKDVCMREIELANGLENDSYAESIQRLSDLEWLLHKQLNESIIDGLFTGQLVEALLCTSNNRISVNLQTFNVLPVPLAAPRPVSGLVMLEDCFTAFCNIEKLVSSTSGAASSAWDSDSVQRSQAGDLTTPAMTVRTRSGARSSTVAPSRSPLDRMSAVSPIAGQPEFVNDSGFCDNVFKTSTPIREAGSRVGGPSPSDVQRRCLLSQLPECLIIQLMRFHYDVQQGRSTKLRAPVSIRLKGLDLQEVMCDTVTQREGFASPAGQASSQMYDLYGLCLHMGAESTHHGHYVSYSLASDARWYRYDDETVTEVNIEYELTTKEVRQNAYLLFYKRAAT